MAASKTLTPAQRTERARKAALSATPAQRTERARKAALARNTVDAHIRALVDAAPTLTTEQRDRLAGLLDARSAARES